LFSLLRRLLPFVSHSNVYTFHLFFLYNLSINWSVRYSSRFWKCVMYSLWCIYVNLTLLSVDVFNAFIILHASEILMPSINLANAIFFLFITCCLPVYLVLYMFPYCHQLYSRSTVSIIAFSFQFFSLLLYPTHMVQFFNGIFLVPPLQQLLCTFLYVHILWLFCLRFLVFYLIFFGTGRWYSCFVNQVLSFIIYFI
jgi:hypothetical protein